MELVDMDCCYNFYEFKFEMKHSNLVEQMSKLPFSKLKNSSSQTKTRKIFSLPK